MPTKIIIVTRRCSLCNILRLFCVQLTQFAGGIPAIIIINAVGHIRILLDFGNQDPFSDSMPKVSCATLETVMNLAALNSVYQSHEHIQKEDIIEALLQVVYKLQKTDKETDSSELQKIAVHEAAHAVVGEVLHPGSIGIVTVRGSQGVIGGMANGCATYAQNEEEFLDEVTKTLAGRAGVSLIYGVMDIQASADIEQADKLMDIWQCHFAGGGFVGIESGDNRMSEQRLSYNEAIKSAKLEELYRRAYKILHDNRDFLLAVQKELLEHETLLISDLAKIRESCI